MFENPKTEIERKRRARAVGQGKVEDGNGCAGEQWWRRGVIASSGVEDGGQALVMPVLVIGVVVKEFVQLGRSGEEQREEKAGKRRDDNGGAKPGCSQKSRERPLGTAASVRGGGWSARSHNCKVNLLVI